MFPDIYPWGLMHMGPRSRTGWGTLSPTAWLVWCRFDIVWYRFEVDSICLLSNLQFQLYCPLLCHESMDTSTHTSIGMSVDVCINPCHIYAHRDTNISVSIYIYIYMIYPWMLLLLLPGIYLWRFMYMCPASHTGWAHIHPRSYYLDLDSMSCDTDLSSIHSVGVPLRLRQQRSIWNDDD